MNNTASELRRQVDGFNLSTAKVGQKINAAGDIWKDANYDSLKDRIGDLAKSARAVSERGDGACSSIGRFFSIAAEEV